MRYTSDAGVPNKLATLPRFVQTVRLPRDVIITNQGLVHRTGLALGVQHGMISVCMTVVFRPAMPSLSFKGQGTNDFIPIECTAITLMAVGAKGPVRPPGRDQDGAAGSATAEIFNFGSTCSNISNRGFLACRNCQRSPSTRSKTFLAKRRPGKSWPLSNKTPSHRTRSHRTRSSPTRSLPPTQEQPKTVDSPRPVPRWLLSAGPRVPATGSVVDFPAHWPAWRTVRSVE